MHILLVSLVVLFFSQESVKGLKMASFNIQNFGVKKTRNPELMAVLGKIIRRYDAVFIHEIRDKSQSAFQALLNAVNGNERTWSNAPTGPRGRFCGRKITRRYVGHVGPRYGRTASKEQVGLIYRPDKIELAGNYTMNGLDKAFERPPYCYLLSAKKDGFKFASLAVHIDPDVVFAEMETLYKVAPKCVAMAHTENLIILGDMNAGCGYLSNRKRELLSLRRDTTYKWLIGDDVDTTVAKSKCAYDRFICKGAEIIGRVSSAGVFNFLLAYNFTVEKAKTISDHFPIELDIS
uniref:Deoxyribonuclease n=1 Tax=Mesocestoides corti TaxID=53468 RepID=A0A5K3F7E4_MESCO